MQENKFGEFASEKVAIQNEFCRKLAANITDLGVSERQRLFLIYLLAMELENVEHMKELTATVREMQGDATFIVDIAEKQEE